MPRQSVAAAGHATIPIPLISLSFFMFFKLIITPHFIRQSLVIIPYRRERCTIFRKNPE
jgi:hypothetical protein